MVNANTIFIGLPLNTALFGENSMPYFLVYYVLNTVSTWTFGAFLIAGDSCDETQKAKKRLNWKKLLPAPLLGFLAAMAVLLSDVHVPAFIHSSLGYLGSMVTPLSLIYIGIMLCDAGLASIRFDRDTVIALLGKFVFFPLLTAALVYSGRNALPIPALEAKTLILQSSVSALAILPILANEAGADVRYVTNVVTTSTLFFVAVAPVADSLLQMIPL